MHRLNEVQILKTDKINLANVIIKDLKLTLFLELIFLHIL